MSGAKESPRCLIVDDHPVVRAGVRAVLETVLATGQFAADAQWVGMQTIVSDGGATTFRLNADGTPVTVSVYALGDFSPDQEPPNIPTDELAVYQALSQLLEQLTTLDAWLPAEAWAQETWQPYLPDTIRLYARNADADLPDDGGTVDERPWPNESDAHWTEYGRSEWGELRCRIASGDDADAWYQALSTADQSTRFILDDHRYHMSVRLLLPDERRECPGS